MNKISLLFSKIPEKLVASLVSIVIGLFTGCAVIFLVAVFNKDITLSSALEGVKLVLFGVFSKGRDLDGNLIFGFNGTSSGDLLFRAMPLIMTGLSVCFAFRSGLFNIGAPGQYLIGTASTLIVALTLSKTALPSAIIWIAAFLCGMLFGALWGIIPGVMRAVWGINEVLSCIMTNWIAANLVTFIFENSPFRNLSESGKTGYIMPTSSVGISTAKLGLDKIFPYSQINAGIIVALAFAVAVYIIISKTTLGFELRICGSNRFAARYVGIKEKRQIILAMGISGALSAGGAALYYLSGNTEFFWSTYQSLPREGFTGIPVALLASNNPVGVIFSACFMSWLNVSGRALKDLTAFNENTTDIIIAVIVYLSAFSLLIGNLLYSKKKLSLNSNGTSAGVSSSSCNFSLTSEKAEKSAKEEQI